MSNIDWAKPVIEGPEEELVRASINFRGKSPLRSDVSGNYWE